MVYLEHIKYRLGFEMQILAETRNSNKKHEDLYRLALSALEFGFLKESSLVSDSEFTEFQKKEGSSENDIRAVIHGLERLNNSDPYAGFVYFFNDVKEIIKSYKSNELVDKL